MPDTSSPPGAFSIFAERRVALIGKMGGVTKREARDLVRGAGGLLLEAHDSAVDLIIVGADTTLFEYEQLIDERLQARIAEERVQVLHETELWELLGYVEADQQVRRLYTPAMLADLLAVPISVVRRWHRRKLILPVREVNRLPYFDFREVATAQRLAELLAAGASPHAIEKKIDDLSRFVPDVQRPLAQLSVIVEGRDLLLRQGDGLVEPGGQMRFDFGRECDGAHADDSLSFVRQQPARTTWEENPASARPALSADAMLTAAAELEDAGRLDDAAEVYRAYMMRMGPDATTCFALAELLYRSGDVGAARERYYMAIELDDEYVEARANLGCVLAELGQSELALAAFQGALERHADYPDVHYHLAILLEDMGRDEEALAHWRLFARLAPDSPWADEARHRLDGDDG